MRRIRRDPPEARIELNPLIDLMTFLLTFFIYAVVMMVRVDLVPMDLKQFASGKPAKPATAATISVLRTGKIFFNKEEVEMNKTLSQRDFRIHSKKKNDTKKYSDESSN